MDNHNIQPRKTNSKNKNTNSLAIQQAHLGHTQHSYNLKMIENNENIPYFIKIRGCINCDLSKKYKEK